MAGAGHLVRRFFGSLRPGGPARADDEWACKQLLPNEVELWRTMSGPDRRHAVGVARRVEIALGHEASRPVLAAALLHDVGKVASGLHTFGRVIATLSAKTAGMSYARAWSYRDGFTRKVGLYLRHPDLGGDMLALAGSDALTICWTRQHHLPEDQWTVPPLIGAALKSSDDD
ncbi:MAG: hypothetical protein QOE63_1984 [Acidimicrobiaceae bacterium]|jgi:hypothetical protein